MLLSDHGLLFNKKVSCQKKESKFDATKAFHLENFDVLHEVITYDHYLLGVLLFAIPELCKADPNLNMVKTLATRSDTLSAQLGGLVKRLFISASLA